MIPPVTVRIPLSRTWIASARSPALLSVGSPFPFSTRVPSQVVPSCSPSPRTSVSILNAGPSCTSAAYVSGSFSFEAGASGRVGFCEYRTAPVVRSTATFCTRAARVSAAPYMATVNSEQAASVHNAPVAVASKLIPRATATAISTTIWSAVIAKATTRFATTKSGRGMGAASSSDRAPDSRSTSTPRPANIVFRGISSPIVPVATNDS